MQEAEKEKLYKQLKDAVVAIKKLKADLQQERSKKNEPIAVIGMAMRLPGGVMNAEDYWNLLIQGKDAVTDIPESRFDAKAFYDVNYETPGKMVVKQGGFLEQIDQFDGSFFDISYAELESMDPQQRLLLEVAHEATENAGIPVKSLYGTKTGVFIGVTNIDYQKRHFRSGDYTLINPYSYTGATICSNSGRISYLMGLQGPSVSIDTACSSSLVTTHLAVQSLRNGECDMAFTGAANLIIDPEFTIYFSHLNALSADSRCKSFSDDANGFIRSEGCGLLLLKRLSDAQKDGDNILAVVEGSAVNQDGRSNGFTAPNVLAQENLLREAIKNAGLKPEDIGYIEAHGTGTKIGDPIEMEAISAVYSSAKTKDQPLIVGSVKSNIGHTEGVAGVAGSIKSILVLQHQEIPKNLHFNKPNELIDWANIPIKIPTERIKLDKGHLHIGVSGFGVTGTNAHVILGAAPQVKNKESVVLRDDIFILPLSARTEDALKALAKVYAEFIQKTDENLEDICAMTALRRSRYELAEVFVAGTKDELIEKLNDFSELEYEEQVSFDSEDAIKTVFVCPGQGAQWVGMAKQLYETEPIFKKSLDDIALSFSKFVNWNLITELNGENYEELDIIQPVLVAIEIALGELWKSKGITPDIVVGHSMGEVAAAYLAEMITLDEAAQIICTRSKLMKQTSGQGAMMVTDLTLEEAEKRIADKKESLSIAVQNSSNSTVISGSPKGIELLLAQLDSEGRFCRKIKVDVASHSPQMDAVLPDLKAELENIHAQNSKTVFYSTALNEKVDGEKLNADYWVKNLRNTVQFGAVIRSILSKDKAVFIELSPHPVLTNAIQENIEELGKQGKAIPTLFREKDELESFYKAFGKYFESGLDVNWKNIYPDINQFVILPNYQWQRERFWFDEKPNISASQSSETLVTKNETIAETIEEIKEKTIFYEPKWEVVNLSNQELPKSVLIIKDDGGLAEQIENLLLQKGVRVEKITTSETPQHLPEAVIHLASTNQKASLHDAVFSLQDLITYFQDKGKSPQLYAVSKNAQVLNDHDKANHIPGAVLWGVMRTLQNEFPELQAVTIDINDATQAEQIVRLIGQDKTYKEFAIRSESVFVPILKTVEKNLETPHSFSSEGTYLITGGTSGLGLYFAEWLTTQGVKSLALVSRSGMKSETQSVVDSLKAKGIHVEVYASDVSNPNNLKTLVQNIESKQATISGVVHAAGVLDDGAFLNLSVEQFNKVLSPKINGAWNLHTFFKNRELESFILFSSAASILGTVAQANYNAGNMVLDQLAHLRKSLNLPALTINFGNIGEIGLAAADVKRGERLKEQGMNTMTPNDLSQYFSQLFQLSVTQCVLIDIDFDIWSENNEGVKGNHFYKYVLSEPASTKKQKELKYTNKNSAIRYYKTVLKGMISKITKIPVVKIKEDATFKSMGIDSLMAVQLKNAVQKESGLTLAVSSIWTYPTVEKYTDFIVGELKIEEGKTIPTKIEDGVRNWTYINKNAAIKDFKNIIKGHISVITKIPITKIKEDATFKSMGIDSLMAVQLKNKFQTEFGINIAVSSIWTYSTVEKYAHFIADELYVAEQSKQEEPVVSPVQQNQANLNDIEKQVDEMSLDDLLNALDEE